MESQTAIQAIQQFVIFAKATKGKGAQKVVKDCLEHPHTFTFGELLSCPSVAALQESSDGGKPLYELLALFAYGTWKEYNEQKGKLSLPELTPRQIFKLKQLTIVSLSATRRLLSYELLLSELDLPNVRSLEDMLIESIYQELIRARLDQRGKQVEVLDAIGRDIKPGEIEKMQKKLETWFLQSNEVLRSLENLSKHAQDSVEKTNKAQDSLAKKLEEQRDNVKGELADHYSQGGMGSRGMQALMGGMGGMGGFLMNMLAGGGGGLGGDPMMMMGGMGGMGDDEDFPMGGGSRQPSRGGGGGQGGRAHKQGRRNF